MVEPGYDWYDEQNDGRVAGQSVYESNADQTFDSTSTTYK